MASTFTRASPYLQQTAKQLASRKVQDWTYPIWAYVVGCVGVAAICALNGFVSSMIEKRSQRITAEKDLEAGILAQVPTDGTFPDSVAKGAYMHQDGAMLESDRKVSLPTKMKQVFHKFGKGKSSEDDVSVTVVDTSATNTTARNSRDWKRDSKGAEIQRDAIATNGVGSETTTKLAEEKIEFVERK